MHCSQAESVLSILLLTPHGCHQYPIFSGLHSFIVLRRYCQQTCVCLSQLLSVRNLVFLFPDWLAAQTTGFDPATLWITIQIQRERADILVTITLTQELVLCASMRLNLTSIHNSSTAKFQISGLSLFVD